MKTLVMLVAVFALGLGGQAVAEAAPSSELARQLLRGCLAAPDKAEMERFAASVGATPYSEARTKRELGRKDVATVVDDNTRPGEAQRTEMTVTAFAGWDLPGPSAGGLEYVERNYRMARIEVAWSSFSRRGARRGCGIVR